MLPQEREQFLLAAPDDGVVMALVHGGRDEPLGVGSGDKLLHLLGRVVGDAKLLDLAGPECLVERLVGVLKGRRALGHVEVVDVDLGLPQRLEREPDALADLVLRVHVRVAGPREERLAIDGEALAGLNGAEELLRRPGRLRGVAAGRVDLTDASLVDRVKHRVDLFRAAKGGQWRARLVSELDTVRARQRYWLS